MFFNDWFSLLRIVVVGTLAYAGVVLFLRVAGKRTLSKMNAFDLVVTVAFGSTLATTILSRDVALAEGLVAFALLILLQFLITWTSAHWRGFQRVVKAEPRLIAFEGKVLEDALRRERVTDVEVDSAVREAGLPGVESTYAVVLETDGTVSVIPRHGEAERYQSLRYVEGAPDQSHQKMEPE
ncbi:MAG: DUF421 domain-containing protein [Gemmatimonadetes bacterium]|nr:DUF421 domain-containing protein [Gemmatimonadota bacterium]